jgi:hypothetical protein
MAAGQQLLLQIMKVKARVSLRDSMQFHQYLSNKSRMTILVDFR